ncbi:MAG: 50S ribosomal protein L25/general stress protein Ctc [Desulfobacterales bacterium]
MEFLELKVNKRKSVGNGPARVLRREKKTPAVLYGPQIESILLTVNNADLENAIKKSKGGQVFINLMIQNGKAVNHYAMIKELQTHPVSGDFLHVDFYEIALERKIKVGVPVVTKGKSKGVELGGVLQLVRRELEVSCLPAQIPEAIEIDITDLDIGDSVHVEEIHLEGDVEFEADVNFTVVTVLSPKVEEEEEEVEEEAEAEVSEEEEAQAESEGEEP